MYGGDCTVKLMEPTRAYCREIEAYRNAFLECGDSMDGTGSLKQFEHPEDWISYLETYGGHIGYSVAPGERRKGYASQMLKEALIKCRELGIDKVLITCTDNNEGSRKTILANGGIYESTVYEPEEKVSLERYWITISE